MSRISDKFSNLKRNGQTALITYLTAGDPNLELTKEIVYRLEERGADIIELGVPFSDPMADGPTIQLSSERALRNNTSLGDILVAVREIRRHSQIPIVLFGYYNPFLAYGHSRFARDAKEAGVDGVLVVDLPPEEAEEFKAETDKTGLDFIFLLAPTSTKERIELVASKASGFVYLVSVTGVTGARPGMDYSLEGLVAEIRRYTDLPVGIGFGVSTPEQARRIAKFSDAVIVGSAIVKIIEQYGGEKEVLLDKLGAFVKELSNACHC